MFTRLGAVIGLCCVLSVPVATGAAPIDTAITYQGSLLDGGSPASGSYDFSFQLYDGVGGIPVSGTVLVDDIAVVDGVFNVQLDFAAGVYDGEARWIEIGVRDGGSTGGYTILSPLLPLTPAPQSQFAVNSGQLDGMGAGQFALSGHTHALLTPATGLQGAVYDGSTASSWTVDFGAASGQVAPGDAGVTVNAGFGLSGDLVDDPIGDGVVIDLDVGANYPLQVNSSALGLTPGFLAEGLYNAGTASNPDAAVGAGDGIAVSADAVSARVDASTIGFNGSGELQVLAGAGVDYARHAVVAKSGGDYTDPVVAMNDLANWCGTPGPDFPCLLRIMPGRYTLSQALALESYVDIQGSGPTATLLNRQDTGTGSGVITGTGACGGRSCEVRDLGIRTGGMNVDTVGIHLDNSNPRLSNLRIELAQESTGTAWGLRIDNANHVRLRDLFVDVDGDDARGLYLTNSTIVSVVDSRVFSEGAGTDAALYTEDVGDLRTRDSEFNANGTALQSDGAYVLDSQLTDQGSRFQGGAGSGNTNPSVGGHGIYAESSTGSATVFLDQSTANASDPGAARNTGIYLRTTSARVAHSTVNALDDQAVKLIGSTARGGDHRVRVWNAKLNAGSASPPINGATGFDVRVGHSRLFGTSVTGTVTCVSVVDGAYNEFSGSCP